MSPSEILKQEVTMTRLELITVMEDAFIDGWNKKDCDWYNPQDFLEAHKQYGESSETTIAIDNLKEGH